MNLNTARNLILAYLLGGFRDKIKVITKGAFGKRSNNVYNKQGNLIISTSANDLGNYKTLKIIPRSKRTKDNCNSCGVKK